jgi:hypothetical protein
MVAHDEATYGDLATDGYLEFRVASDLGPVEIGLSVGHVYREATLRTYSSRYGYSYDSYTMEFVPVEFHVNLLPVRLGAPRCPAQPYVGMGLGAFVATGDNSDSYAMISPSAGVEFFAGRFTVLGFDVTYHHVFSDNPGSEGENFDYTTVMFCYRFRIPLAGGR